MKAALDAYLRDAIPLYVAMSAFVERADFDSVVIAAPLAPNTNHQGTAFGGSIASLATLACWGWLWVRLQENHAGAVLVVAHADIEYLKPVTGAFSARCDAPPPPKGSESNDSDPVLAALARKGRARVQLTSTVVDASGAECARYTGRFVAHLPR